MFHIILVHPEIPPNTGNIIRLAANTGAQLHLIEPLGFSMDEKALRRAGLDYHEFVNVRLWPDWPAFLAGSGVKSDRLFAFTTQGAHHFHETSFERGDGLVFGRETAGLPPEIRDGFPPQQRLRLPMRAGQRSLNLSNAVAVAVFEAWRQMKFEGGT